MSTRVLRSNKRRLLLLGSHNDSVTPPTPQKKQKSSRSRPRRAPTADTVAAASASRVPGAIDRVLQEPTILRGISKYLWVRDIKSLMLASREWEEIWTPCLYRSVGIQQQSVWSAKKSYPQLDRFGPLIEKLYFNNYRTKVHGAMAVLRSTQCSGNLTDMHIPSFTSRSRGSYSRFFGPELQFIRTLRVTLDDYDMVYHYDDLLKRINTLPHLTSLTLEECSTDMLLPLLRFLRDNKLVNKLRIRNMRVRYGPYGFNRLDRVQVCSPLPADLAELNDSGEQSASSGGTDKDMATSPPTSTRTLWQNTAIRTLGLNCEMLSYALQFFSHTAEFVHPDVRAFFGRLPNLEKCHLEWSHALKLSDFKYVVKTSLANVTEIKIGNCYLVSMLPILAQGCPRLTSLFIQNTQTSGCAEPLPGRFDGWPELRSLRIDGDLISDRQVNELAQSPTMRHTLKHLVLRMCRRVKGETIRRLLGNYDQLETLHVLSTNASVTTMFETDRPWACHRTLKTLSVDLTANQFSTFPRPSDLLYVPSDAARFHIRRQLYALQNLEILILFGLMFTWDMLYDWPSSENIIMNGDRYGQQFISKLDKRKTTRARPTTRSATRTMAGASSTLTTTNTANSNAGAASAANTTTTNAAPAAMTAKEKEAACLEELAAREEAFLQLYVEHASDPGWEPYVKSTTTSSTTGAAATVPPRLSSVISRVRLLDAGPMRDGATREAMERMNMAFEKWYKAQGLERMFAHTIGWSRTVMRTRIKDHNIHFLREHYDQFSIASRHWPMTIDMS